MRRFAVKIAVLTSRLDQFSGSEIVALEAATHFASIGHIVTVQADKISPDMFTIADSKYHLQVQPLEISEYDFVWSQHGQFLHNISDPKLLLNWRGSLVSVHLSYYHPIETLHHPISKRFATMRLFNADVTRDTLEGKEETDNIYVLRNAAPLRFHQMPSKSFETLRNILIVSNHLPNDLLIAAKKLEELGFKIKIIGKGHIVKILEPSDFFDIQAVISIGKTVQYALVAGIPVFCYDHFGGPGWLSELNIRKAEYLNFNGTCSTTRESPHEIVQDIINGYEEASSFSKLNWPAHSDRYNLNRCLDEVLLMSHGNKITTPFDILQIEIVKNFSYGGKKLKQRLKVFRKVIALLFILCIILLSSHFIL